ncbi:SufD family Fe-S cluster assembly protein [Candidatus Gracilibacteria bacterium]|nr:SufD family Fe-S cluster assembly protein [Candidatus Gracilibacteria bacterium]
MEYNFKNPSGKKQLEIQAHESIKIFLEDFSNNSTSFHLKVNLLGNYCKCEIIGRAQSSGSIKKTWKISQKFLGKSQKGSINLHGIAEDNSFLEFDGKGFLEKISENADINITEKILLFDKAKGKSLPILTVKTDKVKKAKHAASITPLSEELIFYCESRGIALKKSKKILTRGFLKI